jgi:peptide/nickel transport system ATP-binding protein
MAIMGLLPLIGGRISGGALRFDGHSLQQPEPILRKLRGRRIAFITQNPMTALDPVQRVGPQVDVVAEMHLGLDRRQARARTIDLLTQLRIPDASTICHAYPHQLSGGMKQRIVIAMALAGEPDLIIADEPTTALDVTVQAQIIHILGSLVRDRGLGLLLITHDMGVVAQVCTRVAVLYAGRVAETRAVEELFAAPAHPYSRALIDCIPHDFMPPGSLRGIPGAVPTVSLYPSGCRFHPRCASATTLCATQVPISGPLGAGFVACHHPLTGDRHG